MMAIANIGATFARLSRQKAESCVRVARKREDEAGGIGAVLASDAASSVLSTLQRVALRGRL
jgi:hypothetical protein